MMSDSQKKSQGFTMIPNNFMWNVMSKVSGNAVKVLLVIGSFNPSFPSYTKISQLCGLARSTIVSCVKELLHLKLIEYQKGNVDNTSNQYKVCDLNNFEIEAAQKLDMCEKSTGGSSKSELGGSLKSELGVVRNSACNNTNSNNTNNTITDVACTPLNDGLRLINFAPEQSILD